MSLPTMRNTHQSKARWRGKARTANNEVQSCGQSMRALSGRLPVTEHLLRNADHGSLHQLILDLCNKDPGIDDQVTTRLYFSQQNREPRGQPLRDEQGRRGPPSREIGWNRQRPRPRVLKPIDRAGNRWLKSQTTSSADQPESNDDAGPHKSADGPESRRANQSTGSAQISSTETHKTQAGTTSNSQELGADITSKQPSQDQTDETINKEHNGNAADCKGTSSAGATRCGRSHKENKRKRAKDPNAESAPESGRRKKRAKDGEAEGRTESHKRGDATQDSITNTATVLNHGEGETSTEKSRKSVKKHKNKHKDQDSRERKRKKRHLESQSATVEDMSDPEPPGTIEHSITSVNSVDDARVTFQEKSKRNSKAKDESSTDKSRVRFQKPVMSNKHVVVIDLSEELDSIRANDEYDLEKSKILAQAAEIGVRMHSARIAHLKHLNPEDRDSYLRSLRTNDLAFASEKARSSCHTPLSPANITTFSPLTRDLADQGSSQERNSRDISACANSSLREGATREPVNDRPYQQADATLQYHPASPPSQHRPKTNDLGARSIANRTSSGHQTPHPREAHLCRCQHGLTMGPLLRTVGQQGHESTPYISTISRSLVDQREGEQQEQPHGDAIKSTRQAPADQVNGLVGFDDINEDGPHESTGGFSSTDFHPAHTISVTEERVSALAKDSRNSTRNGAPDPLRRSCGAASERLNPSLSVSTDVYKQDTEQEDYGYVEPCVQSLDARNEDVEEGSAQISHNFPYAPNSRDNTLRPDRLSTMTEGEAYCETPDAKPRLTSAGNSSPREPVRVRCVACKKLFVPTSDLLRECVHHSGKLQSNKWDCCGGRKDHIGCEQTAHEALTPSIEL